VVLFFTLGYRGRHLLNISVFAMGDGWLDGCTGAPAVPGKAAMAVSGKVLFIHNKLSSHNQAEMRILNATAPIWSVRANQGIIMYV